MGTGGAGGRFATGGTAGGAGNTAGAGGRASGGASGAGGKAAGGAGGKAAGGAPGTGGAPAIKFYVDDNLYETQTPTTATGRDWEFNQPFFIILNVAVGGNFPGAPSSSTTFRRR